MYSVDKYMYQNVFWTKGWKQFRNKTDIRIYLSHRLRSVPSDFPDCLDSGVGLCTGFPRSLYSPPPPPRSPGPDRWTGPQTLHGTGEGSAEHSHSHFLLYSSAHLNNNSKFNACFIQFTSEMWQILLHLTFFIYSCTISFQ